ncbi:ATP-binding protein [Limnoglobus roseus]|uniref:ATP-binding protein n=1 Tax=Limnoglobus roseus TaxID=2598579 RepID=UPI00143D4822|nr:ATP-binding protein [Limnoglobus roseus]
MTDLPAGVWPVLADPGQLEQVLLNLAVNARDAMPKGGTLTVSARNETVSADADVAPGRYAVLSVTDTGTGMPPEVVSRAFEPFFTTKEVGKGTGLGLATVYGIVRQAGGYVRVRSKVGEGSTFEVLLPWTKDANADAAGKSGIRRSPLGQETVLVVEDETAVRALVRLVLKKFGYTVLEAADGLAAEKLAAAHKGPIHLVLSDVVMPGAGGRAAVEGILDKHPEAKVVFMSGYTDDAIMRQGVSASEVPFLQKPFTPNSLATKVREVLDVPRRH